MDNHELSRFNIICEICRSDDTSVIFTDTGVELWCNECEEGERLKE